MTALKGEVALVTGGASGLGRAIVDRFIEEGSSIVVLDRSAGRLDDLVEAHGESLRVVTGDVRSAADNALAVETALKSFGKLDCAIGNAGIWDYARALDQIEPGEIDGAFSEMFDVNVKGYLHLAKAALPSLAASGGSLIYTISNAGFDPAGGGVLYTAAKHAVVGLVRQLAYEFAPVVRVNGVAPGPIETDLRGPGSLGLADLSIGNIGLKAIAAPNVPLAMVPAAEDYAGAYVMLASRRDNRAATGGVIALDAGIAVRGIGAVSAGAHLATKYGEARES